MDHPSDKYEDTEALQIELLRVANAGGESETVKNVLEGWITGEKEMILHQFSHIPPNVADYAKLAGRAQLVLAMEQTLDLKIADGKEAQEDLNTQGE